MESKSLEKAKPKRKVVVSTIEVKKKIISKHESGTRLTDLASMFKMSKSTISSILKNKEAIKAANVAKGVTTLTSRRSRVIEEMEKLLLVWINEKRLTGEVITEKIICERAKLLHSELKKRTPETSTHCEEFKGSRGWFDKFKKRTGMHSVVLHGETSGAEDNFIKTLEYADSEGFAPQHVFNCDETDIFWKKFPGEIVSVGLELSDEDVDGSFDEHQPELGTKELQQLHKNQQKEAKNDAICPEGTNAGRCISHANLEELLSVWHRTQALVEKWHPNKTEAATYIKLFDENVMAYFKNINVSRQLQTRRLFSAEKRNCETTPSTPSKKHKEDY